MTDPKVVPSEPTQAMLDAGCAQHECAQGDPYYSAPDLSEADCRAVWTAMVAAAPKQDAGAVDDAMVAAALKAWHSHADDEVAMLAALMAAKHVAQRAALAPPAAAPQQGDGLACNGANCGSTDHRFHSAECYAEHEATVAAAVAADQGGAK